MIKKYEREISALGIIFIFDAIMLPVYNFIGIPFKYSYAIALILILVRFYAVLRIGYVKLNNSLNRTIFTFIVLICLTIMGELILNLLTQVIDVFPFVYGTFLFMLIIGSILVGYHVKLNNYKIIVYFLFSYIVMNFAFVLFSSQLSWLIEIYLPSHHDGWEVGVNRVTGTADNPNGTLLIMNIAYLSVVVLMKRNLISINNPIESVLLLIMPLSLHIIISSRGELIATVLLTLYYFINFIRIQKMKYGLLASSLLISIVLLIISNLIIQDLYNNNNQVKYSIDRVLESDITDTKGNDKLDTILRPLLHLDEFVARFKISPLLGTGYGAGNYRPFTRSADSFHNDWFRIGVSSGIIGIILWFSIIKKAVNYGGIIMLVPFLTTALTNTFVRAAPALMIYFYLYGVLIRRIPDSQSEFYSKYKQYIK